jgi:hypothetical protein
MIDNSLERLVYPILKNLIIENIETNGIDSDLQINDINEDDAQRLALNYWISSALDKMEYYTHDQESIERDLAAMMRYPTEDNKLILAETILKTFINYHKEIVQNLLTIYEKEIKEDMQLDYFLENGFKKITCGQTGEIKWVK